MSEDSLTVPDLPPRRVLQEGTCVRCGKLVSRESPAQRWTDQFGRDRCRESWEDDQCDVRRFTERELEPVMVPATATGYLYYQDEAGEPAIMQQAVPEGAFWEEIFPEPVTITGWRIAVLPPKLT